MAEVSSPGSLAQHARVDLLPQPGRQAAYTLRC